MSRDLYWIWLSLRMGAGRVGLASLLEHFGSPENIYEADPRELSDFFGNRQRALKDALMNKKLDEAYDIESYCAKKKISILRYAEAGYPKQLTSLKDPPVILYARGKIADLDSRVAIAVVGTRSLSEYGRQSAYKIGYELAAAGAVVVGGLALGIDSDAACGALDARGRTVAVLGSGLDRVYPPVHKKLAAEVAARGLLLSEYPPLMPPSRGSFPKRNRIISGLSQGTLVVEAGEESGALITAKAAVVQGRDLYAVPGNIDVDSATGTNGLIKDGATAVTCAADVLENYKYIYASTLNPSVILRMGSRSNLKRGALRAHGVEEPEACSAEKPQKGKQTLRELLHLSGRVDGETVKQVSGQTEYPVYDDDKRDPVIKRDTRSVDCVKETDISGLLSDADGKAVSVLRAMPVGRVVEIDSICEKGFEAQEVMSALTMLELQGLVEVLPGNRFMRK